MTASTLRPNGTAHATTSVTGAATQHAALSDDTDASYVTSTFPNYGWVDVGTVSLPALAVTKTITVRERSAGTGAGGFAVCRVRIKNTVAAVFIGPQVSTLKDTTISTVSGSPNAITLSQAEIDGLQIEFLADSGTSGSGRFYELYLDLVYAEAPVANITTPTGTPAITTTNKPTFVWTHTPGSDGGAQTFWEAKVYSAAQYGAGGFSPDTSATTWGSGITIGAATTIDSGALPTGVTYRVYVRTAQTINGVAHWSAWDFEGFSISVTTADVSAIATTADAANGRILIAVDRSGSAWNFVEVQRSVDSGATWSYVRGGAYVPPATATLYSTGDANNFDLYDYELSPSTSALYRARATRILSGLPITGAWVQSTPAISWAATELWMKAPLLPAINDQFCLHTDRPAPQRSVRQGVHAVLGAALPTVTFDVLSGRSGVLGIATIDAAEAASLLALAAQVHLLIQFHALHGVSSMYVVVGQLTESCDVQVLTGNQERRWDLSFVEVAAPADALSGL